MPITVNSTVSTSPCLPDGIVAGRAVDRADRAVRERLGVELRRVLARSPSYQRQIVFLAGVVMAMAPW